MRIFKRAGGNWRLALSGRSKPFFPTKNNYEGPSRQNVYPTMMINDVLNRAGVLYAHFEYSMMMEPVIELVFFDVTY